MKRNAILSLSGCFVAAALIGGPTGAQTSGGGGLGGGAGEYYLDQSPANESLAALDAAIAELRSRIAAARAHPGGESAFELQRLETELAQAMRSRPGLVSRITEMRRWNRLESPVTVEFKNATLAMAAESLSQTTRMPVRLEGSVPDTLRISLTTRDAPLVMVLDSVARSFGVQIVSGGETDGVILKPWPTLEVNGKRDALIGPMAPWGNGWPNSPMMTYQSRSGGLNPTAPRLSAGPARAMAVPPAPRAAAGRALVPARRRPATQPTSGAEGGSGDPIGIASLSPGSIVVAERGTGPNGEPGVWLTIYSVMDATGELTRSGRASTFHPATGTPRRSEK